jgi:hypothetical protein
MNTEQERAYQRLVKKLSALRVTLRKDERDLLDVIVLSTPDEITFNSMSTERAQNKAADKASEMEFNSMSTERAQNKAADKASEMEFNSMQVERAQNKAADKASEMEFNSMQTERAQNRVLQIVLDDASQSYRVVERNQS